MISVHFQDIRNCNNLVFAQIEDGIVSFSKGPSEPNTSYLIGVFQRLIDGDFVGLVHDKQRVLMVYNNRCHELLEVELSDDSSNFFKFLLSKFCLFRPLLKLDFVSSNGLRGTIVDDALNQDFDFEESVHHIFDIISIACSSYNYP